MGVGGEAGDTAVPPSSCRPGLGTGIRRLGRRACSLPVRTCFLLARLQEVTTAESGRK